MRRFLRYDQLGNQIGEISANDIMALTRREVINGEHSLEITTFQVLSKNERIVYQDGREVWREYVVEGVDDEHASGNRPIGTYYCTWSVQSDLSGVIVSVMPGTQTPVTAGAALTAALSAQTRWARGTVTNTTTSGASMYDMSTWKALGVLVKNWGGELSTTIGVSADGVISRSVDLYSKMGDQDAKRRFDFGADLGNVKRDIADAPMYCRISPRGKGEQSGDGWGRKVTIESVNAGKDYLEYAPMVDVCKIPDGSGYIYPTLIVENGDCDTPSKLKTWAQGVLESYCTPKITYTVDVLQAAVEGVDVQGVSLGDAVQVVDRYFGDGLRLSGRVIEMTVDELNERDVKLKVGSITQGLSSKFSELSAIRDTVSAINGGTMSTSDFLSRLLDRINGEVNATGGYTYITEGQGLRTYDTAVSDPLIGSEANSVVEIKGGTIRIANSKTAQGAWEWKTVFTSGHIAANLITAANITAGYIGNASGSFWDLDNDILQIASTAGIGDRTVLEVLAGLYESISNVTYEYAQNQSTVNPPSGGWSTTLPTWRSGYRIWKRVATTYGTGDSAYTVRGEPSLIPLNGSAGISSTTCQYYLSTSNTSQEGGSWSTTQPTWQPNRFIWVRLQVNWDNSTTTTTTPELAVTANAMMDAVNDAASTATGAASTASSAYSTAASAASAAANAAKTATNFLTFNSSNGLDIGYSGTSAKTRINGSGVEVFDGNGVSALYAGLSGSNSIVRVGRQSGSGNVMMSSEGYVDIRRSSTVLAHFGYGAGVNEYGGTSSAPYYSIGPRSTQSGRTTIGNYSTTIGTGNAASGYASAAIGWDCYAYGHAAVAIGDMCQANQGISLGVGAVANPNQVAVGVYNAWSADTTRFVVGEGTSTNRANSFSVYTNGNAWLRGSLTQGSDRRLKNHLSYLEDDAVEFVRKLKPALFEKDGGKHLGFYAQDVQEAEQWDSETVGVAVNCDESLDFDPLTLDYTALIAPLVAYAQSLEKRIEQLEQRITALEGEADGR